MTYWVVWSYDVKPEQAKAFERAYGPEGEWAQLFRKAPGYVGTEMRRETDRTPRYFTVDRWTSREDYHRFKENFRNEYQRLDARCAAMKEWEKKVGDFETTPEEIGSGGVQ